MAHLGYRFVSAGAGLAALNGGNAVARTGRYINGSINSLSRQYHNLIGGDFATRDLLNRRLKTVNNVTNHVFWFSPF